MNSRKVVYLFFTTLIIGSISGAIVGAIIDWSVLIQGGMTNLMVGVIWLLGISAAFSLISQMGFFAYLTVHRFGLGLFKSHLLWNRVQLVIIAFVYFDLIYFRYNAFAAENETFLHYAIMPTLLLLYAIVIGYFKKIGTNEGAFVPAVFFIFVVTTIEWVPALTANDPKWLWIYVAPLLVGNTWQLLVLHRLTNKKDRSS